MTNKPPLLQIAKLVLLVFGCSLARVSAQTGSSSLLQRIGRDVIHVAQGTGHVLTAPFRWQGRAWARFGILAGGTLALSFLDEEVNAFFKRHHSRTADKLADLGVEYGEPRTAVIITGSVYLAGLVTSNEGMRESAVILTAALLPAGLVQTASKIAAGRARPHLGLGHHAFDPFRREEAYYSFVSGHTMVAMATSHVFAKRIAPPAAKAGLYSLGALAGTSRMYNEDHWLSDIVLGSALAIASVNSAAKSLDGKQRRNFKTGLRWQVRPNGREVAIALQW